MVAKRFAVGCGIAFAGLMLVAPGVAHADAAGSPHFTVVQGSVAVQGESGSASAANVDTPLHDSDYVTTQPAARAEIQFDAATLLRLAGGVSVRLTRSSANDRQLQLAAGTVEVAMLRDGTKTVSVDTPSVTVRANNEGDYRITVAADGQSFVTARHGHAVVVTPSETYFVDPGKTLVASGAATHPSIRYAAEVATDSFDEFNTTRDNALEVALVQDASSYDGTGASYWSGQQPLLTTAPACPYAPFGSTYYSLGWSYAPGFGGGCPSYGGWYAPYGGGWPYYNVAYWPWYPIWYPYPPRRHRPLPLPPPLRHPFSAWDRFEQIRGHVVAPPIAGIHPVPPPISVMRGAQPTIGGVHGVPPPTIGGVHGVPPITGVHAVPIVSAPHVSTATSVSHAATSSGSSAHGGGRPPQR